MHVGSVDVRDEAERQIPLGVVTEGLVRHHRPEVRAADPDVDHVPDPPSRVAGPRPGPDALGEAGHPVEHLVHLGERVRRDGVEMPGAALVAAVAAVPGSGDDWAYLSSGTWSLLGTEMRAPLLTDRSFFGTHKIVERDGLRIYGNGTTIHGAQRIVDLTADVVAAADGDGLLTAAADVLHRLGGS